MKKEGKYATPRTSPARDVPISWIVWVVCICLVLIVGSFIYGLVHQTNEKASEFAKRHSSLTLTYTYDGEMIRWYVMVDPDTGIEYLVNDRGGTTPRLSVTDGVMSVPDRNE